jgi:Protein of unknown function (DUF3047)
MVHQCLPRQPAFEPPEVRSALPPDQRLSIRPGPAGAPVIIELILAFGGGLHKLTLLGCLFLTAALAAFEESPAVIVFNPLSWPPGGHPAGWQVKVNHGEPDISACSGETNPCLHLKSTKASFGLERSLDLNPYQTRYLAWSWKVAQLPAGGDFRAPSSDDQAAQVLVAFADRHVLSYIWDSNAPKGTMASAPSSLFVHIYDIVCQSGAADLNRWIPEVHDVAADYEHAFGKPAPRIKGVRIQINSQHTGSVAESYFREVVFRAHPQ